MNEIGFLSGPCNPKKTSGIKNLFPSTLDTMCLKEYREIL
ncbi:hypothetical protein DU18_0020 [Chlamydia muridarum]|nr:hypothetical protein DU18_0020 [Chlamydia muridarum]